MLYTHYDIRNSIAFKNLPPTTMLRRFSFGQVSSMSESNSASEDEETVVSPKEEKPTTAGSRNNNQTNHHSIIADTTEGQGEQPVEEEDRQDHIHRPIITTTGTARSPLREEVKMKQQELVIHTKKRIQVLHHDPDHSGEDGLAPKNFLIPSPSARPDPRFEYVTPTSFSSSARNLQNRTVWQGKNQPRIWRESTSNKDSEGAVVAPPPVIEIDLNHTAMPIAASTPTSIQHVHNLSVSTNTLLSSTVPQALMSSTRRSCLVSKGIYCDSRVVPRTQVEMLATKAVQLSMDDDNNLTGQAGWLRDEFRRRVCLVTARHHILQKNVAIVDSGGDRQAICLGHGVNNRSCLPMLRSALFFQQPRPLLLRDGVSWKQGWDVEYGPKKNNTWWRKSPSVSVRQYQVPSNSSSRVFDIVPATGFQYQKGQKVGIVVSSMGQKLDLLLPQVMATVQRPDFHHQQYSRWAAHVLIDDDTEDGDPHQNFQQALIAIYGPTSNSIRIYTGEITRVGQDHLEHNINTHPGCAGAMMFLLPSNVDHPNWGKAVAVHVGFKEALKTNIGLKLRPEKANYSTMPWLYVERPTIPPSYIDPSHTP